MSKVFTITEGLENLGALRTGGQGSVYKGRRLGPIYSAVKLLPTPILTEDKENKNYQNFQNEVAKLQKVNEQPNPHVVKIMSWGLTDSSSFPFIEMEYIEGPDLCDLLQPPREPVFPLKELLKLADQLAGALAHCHRVGVKHGDIKSNNVKYNIHTGNYVLLDFGLAILTDEQRRSSLRHAGAIEFMAPEQHEGHMLPQTDVYSFGVVLYELLTGQVPFPLNGNGETGRNAVMLASIESPVPDPLMTRGLNMPNEWPADKRALEMQVPGWLLQVIEICLEKDPQKRYPSGIELQEAIVNGTLHMTDSRLIQQELQNTTALQTENERLQAQLLQYQQTEGEVQKKLSSLQSIALEAGGYYNASKGVYERNKSIMFMPKRLFMGIAGLGALFMLLFVISLFNRKSNDQSMVSAAAVNYKSPYIYFKPYTERMANAKLAALSKPKAIERADEQGVEKPKKWHKGKPKGRRKRFLGIF